MPASRPPFVVYSPRSFNRFGGPENNQPATFSKESTTSRRRSSALRYALEPPCFAPDLLCSSSPLVLASDSPLIAKGRLDITNPALESSMLGFSAVDMGSTPSDFAYARGNDRKRIRLSVKTNLPTRSQSTPKVFSTNVLDEEQGSWSITPLAVEYWQKISQPLVAPVHPTVHPMLPLESLLSPMETTDPGKSGKKSKYMNTRDPIPKIQDVKTEVIKPLASSSTQLRPPSQSHNGLLAILQECVAVDSEVTSALTAAKEIVKHAWKRRLSREAAIVQREVRDHQELSEGDNEIVSVSTEANENGITSTPSTMSTSESLPTVRPINASFLAELERCIKKLEDPEWRYNRLMGISHVLTVSSFEY